jgi:hypothetical protein
MAEGRFSFVSEGKVDEARENTVPINTKRHTIWSTNVYKNWAKERNKAFEDFEPENNKCWSVPNNACAKPLKASHMNEKHKKH